eukprot:COSAG01_NODE_9682_length_2370_cov_14.974020_2_plen_252_part_00
MHTCVRNCRCAFGDDSSHIRSGAAAALFFTGAAWRSPSHGDLAPLRLHCTFQRRARRRRRPAVHRVISSAVRAAHHIIMPHTLATMVQQLRQLGLQAGDTVFIHSSFNSLGRIDGGAATLLRALEDVVLAAPAASDDGGGGGGGGRLLWPSFNLLSSRELRLSSWDIQRSPSTVGWFSEYVRQQPGTFRSDHYSHSVACRGAGAQEYVSHHLERNGCRSAWDQEHTRFGRTFGDGNPMLRAYAGDGKLLRC